MKKNFIIMVVVLLLMIFSKFTYSQIIVAKSMADSCYILGVKAYKNNEFVDALKYLYAYKIINISRFTEPNKNEVAVNLEKMISSCESYLNRLLIADSKKREEKYGKTEFDSAPKKEKSEKTQKNKREENN